MSTVVQTFGVLNDDEFVIIFNYLVSYGSAKDPFHFVLTCRRFANVLGVGGGDGGDGGDGGGVGAGVYKNYIHSKMVRCTDFSERTHKAFNLGFTAQFNAENRSNQMVKAFMGADAVNTLHCSSSCCETARRAFNEDPNTRYHVIQILPTARLVCSTTDECGRSVHFVYYSEQPNFFISKRTYCADHMSWNQQLLTPKMLPELDRRVFGISCSPGGRFLCIRRLEPEAKFVYIWDTLENQILNPVLTAIKDESFHPPGGPQGAAFECWWASDRSDSNNPKLLISWTTVAGDFAITKQNGDGTNQEVAMRQHGLGPVNIYFSSWYAIIFRTHRVNHKEQICTVADFSNGPDHVKKATVSCFEKDDPVIGQAGFELFDTPVDMCISENGQKLAIIAHRCEYCYKIRPDKHKGVDVPAANDHLILVLFTLSENKNFYYRHFGARDEVFIPFIPSIQSVGSFEIGFSPCESIIHIVYWYNVCITVNDSYPVPSAYFTRLTKDGIQRTRAVRNTKVRALSWGDQQSLVCMPKYGALKFVPKKT